MAPDIQRSALHDSTYGLDVDFKDLALHDKEWRSISDTAKATGWLNFKDPEIVRYNVFRGVQDAHVGLNLLILLQTTYEKHLETKVRSLIGVTR